jgi:parallel beta-helix repeat protein
LSTRSVCRGQRRSTNATEPTIRIALGAKAQITGSTITADACTFVPDCGPDPIFEFQAIGVLVDSAIAGTTVSGNHISGSDVGVYQYASPNCCTISDNTLQYNRYFGIVIQDGDGTTRDNTISGGRVGVSVVAGGADTTGMLRGDSISRTSVAPVREIECCGYTATAIVKT